MGGRPLGAPLQPGFSDVSKSWMAATSVNVDPPKVVPTRLMFGVKVD